MKDCINILESVRVLEGAGAQNINYKTFLHKFRNLKSWGGGNNKCSSLSTPVQFISSIGLIAIWCVADHLWARSLHATFVDGLPRLPDEGSLRGVTVKTLVQFYILTHYFEKNKGGRWAIISCFDCKDWCFTNKECFRYIYSPRCKIQHDYSCTFIK